jgi:hypothetical protein
LNWIISIILKYFHLEWKIVEALLLVSISYFDARNLYYRMIPKFKYVGLGGIPVFVINNFPKY